MFETGELDAIITAVAPSCFLKGAPNVGRLFPDFRAAEEAYYSKTNLFPIMHLVGVRRSLLSEHPWHEVSPQRHFSRRGKLLCSN